jgi:hypothetical protein
LLLRAMKLLSHDPFRRYSDGRVRIPALHAIEDTPALHPLPESTMRGRKPSFTIQLPPAHLQELEHWLRSTNRKHGLVPRARLLVLLHHGHTLKDAARTAL